MVETPRHYALGRDANAARRLAIQDDQFAAVSEALLDDLCLQPDACVVEIGAGAGRFSRRILQRLGRSGLLIAVDFTPELLEQAKSFVAETGPARFETVVADISHPGSWLQQADVVLGRTVVHHLPMAESWFGRLRAILRPGTRIGFVEPEFRALMGRFSAMEAMGNSDLTVLREWAEGIVRYYHACGLSPEIGSNLCWSLSAAGFQNVIVHSSECPTNSTVVENLLLYYDEIRDQYIRLKIMTGDEIDDQKRRLQALPTTTLPAVWGMYRAMADV